MGDPGLAVRWCRARLLFLVVVRGQRSLARELPGPENSRSRPRPSPARNRVCGDEDHGASAQVDAVEEDGVMNLIDDWAERP